MHHGQNSHNQTKARSNGKSKAEDNHAKWSQIFGRFWTHIYSQGWVANVVTTVALGLVFLLVGILIKNPKAIVLVGIGGLTVLLWVLGAILYKSIDSATTETAARPPFGASTGLLYPRSNVLLSKTNSGRIVEIGNSGVLFDIAGPGTEFLSEVFGESRLLVETLDGQMKVSTSIKDASGRMVAEIIKNEWTTAPPPGIWDRNYRSDALEVGDNTGDVILQIVALSDRIKIQGKWYSAGGRHTTLAEGNRPGYALIRVHATDTDPAEHIEPMFLYPSATHLGELRSLPSVGIKSLNENQLANQLYQSQFEISVTTEAPIANLVLNFEAQTEIVKTEISEYETGTRVPVDFHPGDNNSVSAHLQNAFGRYRVAVFTKSPARIFVTHNPY